jgi:hypothetical protein
MMSFGVAHLAQQRQREPAEVGAGDVAVAHLHQHALGEGGVAGDVEAGLAQPAHRHLLAVAQLADEADRCRRAR